jgi:rod shape-determining protein MreC
LFILGASPLLRLLVILTVASTLMLLDHRLNQLQTVRSLLATVAYPLQLLVDAPLRLGHRLLESISSHERLVFENRLLHGELIELRARQLRFEALQMENDRLRALLHTAESARERVQIAQLLSVDLDPFRQQIVLNKGKRHGVYAGQPLVHADGVIGQILVPHWTSSTALLISDPGHAIPVVIARTGLRALALGTGHPRRLELRHVPPQEDIEPGDLLLSSGLGGRFPADYPVARVISVQHLPGQPFLNIAAEPLAALDRAREVLLLWSEPAGAKASAFSEAGPPVGSPPPPR